jgi:hypothetical protein
VVLDQKHGQNNAHRKRKTRRGAEDGAGGEDPEQVDRQDIQRPGGAHRQRLPPQTKGKLFSNSGVKKLSFSHFKWSKKSEEGNVEVVIKYLNMSQT